MKNEMRNAKQYNQMSCHKYKTLVLKDIANRYLAININECSNTYIDIEYVNLNVIF